MWASLSSPSGKGFKSRLRIRLFAAVPRTFRAWFTEVNRFHFYLSLNIFNIIPSTKYFLTAFTFFQCSEEYYHYFCVFGRFFPYSCPAVSSLKLAVIGGTLYGISSYDSYYFVDLDGPIILFLTRGMRLHIKLFRNSSIWFKDHAPNCAFTLTCQWLIDFQIFANLLKAIELEGFLYNVRKYGFSVNNLFSEQKTPI